VRAAQGSATELMRIVDESRVPIVVVDNQRRYLHVNCPARLAFRLSLSEMRRLRIDDLTPPDRRDLTRTAWARLLQTGCVAGPYRVTTPDGGRFDICYWGLANALPGQHVIVFTLAEDRNDANGADRASEAEPPSPLTPRELEILQLAAHGLSGPRIAEELVLSPATVRTHFENLYEKLGVRDRAGAVASGMRLGLIE
jgi:DNA-binding NarL/FixJ family response regulator